MNNFFNTFQKQARMLKLSKEEKQSMRMYIYKLIDEAPALSATQKVAIEDFKKRTPTPSMYYWFSPRFSVPLAIVLLVGLSGGTAFAAQNALPGNPLYTIKVNVNEPVATALATTPTAKAQVNASIATTRLEEAETLASNGSLDATTTALLASNFEQHASEADANTAVVASADPGTAAQLGTTFSSTLAAHGAILAQLASNSGAASVQQNSDALAVRVLAQAEQGQPNAPAEAKGKGVAPDTGAGLAINTSTMTIRPMAVEVSSTDTASSSKGSAPTSAPAMAARTFSALAPSAGTSSTSGEGSTTPLTPSTPAASHISSNQNEHISSAPVDNTVSLALGAQASTTLGLVESDFAALSSSLDNSTTLQIQVQVNSLKEKLASGNNALISGDTELAESTLSGVLRASVRLDAFLKAGKKFNISFLSSLLK